LTINELYIRAHSGDKAAREELFKKLSDRFKYFLRHKIDSGLDVEEVAQETMLTISEKIEALEIESSFAAWAYQVLEFKLARYYRDKRTAARKFAYDGGMQDAPEPAVPDATPSLKRRLLECLKKVSGANRIFARILNLQYQGFETSEICGKLNVTRSNAYIILSRARRALKECLDRKRVE
jgi:RNA polymerase sigma factor (sigma-70 family)